MSKSDMLGSIRRALPNVRGRHLGVVRDFVNKLGGENADAVHHSVAAVLRDDSAPQGQPKLLKRKGHYAGVSLTERHDPDAYYKTREGLYVTDDYRNNIVAAAKAVEAGAKWPKIPRFELTSNMTGS